MTTEEIKARLISSLQSLLPKILPGGKFSSGRYICGSIHGESGNSLSVQTSGANAGAWEDFSTGQNGDILKLFYYQHGEDYKKMIDEAKKAIGENDFSGMEVKTTFKSPTVTWKALDEGPVLDYLTNERNIPINILQAFEVAQTKNGDGYVFLYRSPKGKKLCLSKSVSLKRDEKGKKIVSASKDGMWCLFGMHAHTYEKEEFGNDYVIITEGEIDAMSYAKQGLKAASIPGGVNNTKWIELCWDWLAQFKKIYISFDDDEEGVAATKIVVNRIGIERARVITLLRKDANKCLQDEICLVEAFRSAKEITPTKLIQINELKSLMWEKITKGRREEQGIPFMGWEGDDAINLRLRPRELSIYTGFPGHGKSALLYQLTSFLIGLHGEKVAIASLEEGAEDIANLILFNLIGSVISDDSDSSREEFDRGMDILSGKLFMYHHVGVANIDDVIGWAEYCVGRHGVSHVIIDSVAKTNLDIEDNKEANLFAEKVTTSMNQTGAHYSLVAHSRKGDSHDIRAIPKIDAIKGAAQFGITAFNVITMWRNMLKSELIRSGSHKTKDGRDLESSWGDAKLVVSKQKVGGAIGEYDLWYRPSNGRFRRAYEQNDPSYDPTEQY
jgi:twinkle protein